MKYKIVQMASGVVRVFTEIDSFIEKRDGSHAKRTWDENYEEFPSWTKAMNFVHDRNDFRHPDSSSLFSNVIHEEIIDV